MLAENVSSMGGGNCKPDEIGTNKTNVKIEVCNRDVQNVQDSAQDSAQDNKQGNEQDNDQNGASKHKKKKFRYFDSYIPKVLKHSFENSGITSDARQQLNSILIMFATKISENTLRLTNFASKRTLSVKEVAGGVSLFLPGELKIHAISEGEKAVEQYTTNNKQKGTSRQAKASIIFPPSVAEKFLRRFDTSLIMVTHTAPVYLAAVLEYICIEIIELASIMAKDERRIRITVSDLELSIKGDQELAKVFNDNNIRFLGGGVQQWIHPLLLAKKNAKQESRGMKMKNKANGQPERKYKSGTIAIKDIKKYQKMGNTLIFAKQPFEKFVRQIIADHKTNVKISKNVFSIIQYMIEDYLVNFFLDANAAAIHAGRVKLMVQDIEFVRGQRLGNHFGLFNKLSTKSMLFPNSVDRVISDNIYAAQDAAEDGEDAAEDVVVDGAEDGVDDGVDDAGEDAPLQEEA